VPKRGAAGDVLNSWAVGFVCVPACTRLLLLLLLKQNKTDINQLQSALVDSNYVPHRQGALIALHLLAVSLVAGCDLLNLLDHAGESEFAR
jgi:hypothetical protein